VRRRGGLSLCDTGVAAMWMCNLTFHILRLFNFSNGTLGKLCIKHLLDLQNFVTEKLPDDGTLVPKHAGFGT
jgi:hypothetical protein